MDVDGDGILSMYELEYFYEEQCERMEAMGIEPLPFHDLLCQMLDLVKPASDGKANGTAVYTVVLKQNGHRALSCPDGFSIPELPLQASQLQRNVVSL
jgi:hypothetical protein